MKKAFSFVLVLEHRFALPCKLGDLNRLSEHIGKDFLLFPVLCNIKLLRQFLFPQVLWLKYRLG